jgi:hypothetical protein
MPDSIQKQCEDAIVTTITNLSLTGVATGEVVARRWPVVEGNHPPQMGIVVHPVPPTRGIGTNEREDVGYGVGITVFKAGDLAGYDNRDLVLTWLETIFDKLVEDRLSISLTGGTFLTITWEFGDVQVPKAMHDYERSSMVARCWVRRTRT